MTNPATVETTEDGNVALVVENINVTGKLTLKWTPDEARYLAKMLMMSAEATEERFNLELSKVLDADKPKED